MEHISTHKYTFIKQSLRAQKTLVYILPGYPNPLLFGRCE